MIPWLADVPIFPPVDSALKKPNGLLAAGGDLSPQRLLAAYRRGIFPWFSQDEPILWWSPDPRMVLVPGEFKISRSLAKTLRNSAYEMRSDTAFAEVIRACAQAPRAGQDGTWITPEMQVAYGRLHQLGFAHSIETWVDGRLAGGLYGVALGRVFFGESMFSRERDASKIALAHLHQRMCALDFGIIDCQMETAHLASMGARPLEREAFIAVLAHFTNFPAAPWITGVMPETFKNPERD